MVWCGVVWCGVVCCAVALGGVGLAWVRRIVFCCAVLCSAVLCCAVLCCAELCRGCCCCCCCCCIVLPSVVFLLYCVCNRRIRVCVRAVVPSHTGARSWEAGPVLLHNHLARWIFITIYAKGGVAFQAFPFGEILLKQGKTSTVRKHWVPEVFGDPVGLPLWTHRWEVGGRPHSHAKPQYSNNSTHPQHLPVHPFTKPVFTWYAVGVAGASHVWHA